VKQALAEEVFAAAAQRVKLARERGVAVGSGSDLIGPEQSRRGREIVLKAELIGAEQAILSATRTNAALFRLQDRIGTVEPDKDADLILVSGEPRNDVDLLADPGCIPVVIKAGEVVKDTRS
jgi:imidazolonepropionase-like amidohydrolase